MHCRPRSGLVGMITDVSRGKNRSNSKSQDGIEIAGKDKYMRGYRSRKELSKAKDFQILIGGEMCHNTHIHRPFSSLEA